MGGRENAGRRTGPGGSRRPGLQVTAAWPRGGLPGVVGAAGGDMGGAQKDPSASPPGARLLNLA